MSSTLHLAHLKLCILYTLTLCDRPSVAPGNHHWTLFINSYLLFSPKPSLWSPPFHSTQFFWSSITCSLIFLIIFFHNKVNFIIYSVHDSQYQWVLTLFQALCKRNKCVALFFITVLRSRYYYSHHFIHKEPDEWLAQSHTLCSIGTNNCSKNICGNIICKPKKLKIRAVGVTFLVVK